MSFEKYLLTAGYHGATLSKLLYWQSRFEGWLKSQGYNLETVTSAQLLAYYGNERSHLKGISLGMELRHLGYYYKYKGLENPLEEYKLVKSRSAEKGLCYLSNVDLRALYLGYSSGSNRLLNKVLLGLLIYQGLALSDLYNLRWSSFDWHRGELSIAAGKLAGRVLPLVSEQIHLLLRYEQENKGEGLFNHLTKNGLSCRSKDLVRQVQRQNLVANLKTVRQLRASRIRIWIEQRGLLTAQYYAGHRSLHATELYEAPPLEQLRTAFTTAHPMFKK